jgi:Zn-dependent M28 family amino/carboxypeptidase
MTKNKIKVAMGLGLVVIFSAALFFVAELSGLWHSRLEQTPSPKHPRQSLFDGERAYADLRRVVAFGPRIPGSQPLAKLRAFLEEELRRVGLEVREYAFEADTPLGVRQMVNVVGVVKGTQPEVIILGNHYDTKFFPDFTFVGANDAGSTTAWMLEMARVLGPTREGRSLWLCFFDGEEAFGTWSETDGLYGSRMLVEHLRATGELSRVHAMINVDMIGDCYLGIYHDAGAPGWLSEAVWNKAYELGYRAFFLSSTREIEDDHMPFRRHGIPSINLIDFLYGGTAQDHQRNWHTPRDTLERVCQHSLQVVGDVIYHALPEIEKHLDTVARSSAHPQH